ncbi:MAG: hypothetical protein WBM06_07675, partial [Pseudolabrys sp.]
MSAMEIRTAEPRQSDGVVDWRHFWLANVMIDSGKFEPQKIARYKMQIGKDSLTQRLHRLRRMRAVLG